MKLTCDVIRAVLFEGEIVCVPMICDVIEQCCLKESLAV